MQSKQKGSINCMGESRQLTPGVVSRRYLLEEDESGREKEAGEERRKTARRSSVFDGLF